MPSYHPWMSIATVDRAKGKRVALYGSYDNTSDGTTRGKGEGCVCGQKPVGLFGLRAC